MLADMLLLICYGNWKLLAYKAIKMKHRAFQ